MKQGGGKERRKNQFQKRRRTTRKRTHWTQHGHTPLESLEAEVVVVEVAVHDEGGVEALLVLLYDIVHVVGDEARLLSRLRVHVLVQTLDYGAEHLCPKSRYISYRRQQQAQKHIISVWFV